MKLSNIKTTEQFLNIGDEWFTRLLNLRKIWANETETEKRKEKAEKLFIIMADRLIIMMNVIAKLNLREPLHPGKVGGIKCGDRQEPIVSDREFIQYFNTKIHPSLMSDRYIKEELDKSLSELRSLLKRK